MSMTITSDRRLKDNIQPVFKTLRSRFPGASEEEYGEGSVLQTAFDQLRPVSYDLRTDGQKPRFGFIADEMLDILPEVVRTNDNEEQTKGIIYEDLIALLTARMQGMFAEMSNLNERMLSVEERIQKRKRWRTLGK